LCKPDLFYRVQNFSPRTGAEVALEFMIPFMSSFLILPSFSSPPSYLYLHSTFRSPIFFLNTALIRVTGYITENNNKIEDDYKRYLKILKIAFKKVSCAQQ
jgi:hypothetical protein